jgi:hypothetical protein
MFVREGFAIVAQDTTNVVNTKQLDNTFRILSGMKYDTRRSNATTKIYESAGAMLSIRDYNDNSLVDLCLNERCEYVFTMLANLTSTSRNFQTFNASVGEVPTCAWNPQITGGYAELAA